MAKRLSAKRKPGAVKPPQLEDRRLLLKDVALAPPRQIEKVQFEDLDGNLHDHESDALESSIEFLVRVIAERDVELHPVLGDADEECYVEFVLRNRELLRVALTPSATASVDKNTEFELFMTEKFGKKWRDGDIHLENRAIIEGMREAFLAGLSFRV